MIDISSTGRVLNGSHPRGGRQRIYADNAERQRAYRKRHGAVPRFLEPVPGCLSWLPIHRPKPAVTRASSSIRAADSVDDIIGD